MPLVRVEMWSGRTQAQKAELSRVFTEALVTIAHTTPESVIIVFQDVPKENWAAGGILASETKR